MALRLGELNQTLNNHDMATPLACVKQLTLWVYTRTFRPAYLENPTLVEAVVGETAANAAVLIRSRFESHNDPEMPVGVFGLGASPEGQRADVVPAQVVAEFIALGQALGVTQPSTGPLSGIFVQLIMTELWRYLREHGPELVDDLLNRIYPRPVDPTTDTL